MGSDWGLRTREHEFSTGRTAELRESLPISLLVNQGVFDGEMLDALGRLMSGEIKDADKAFRLAEAVCVGMFIRPELGPPRQDEAGEWLSVPFDVLEEAEVSETLDLAFESVAGAARFRDDDSSAGAGGDGKDVGDNAEPARRVRTRKPGGVRARPKTRRPAA